MFSVEQFNFGFILLHFFFKFVSFFCSETLHLYLGEIRGRPFLCKVSGDDQKMVEICFHLRKWWMSRLKGGGQGGLPGRIFVFCRVFCFPSDSCARRTLSGDPWSVLEILTQLSSAALQFINYYYCCYYYYYYYYRRIFLSISPITIWNTFLNCVLL